MMEVVRDRQWDRPTPAGEGEYGPWFEACAQGKLLIQRCDACGHRQWYPRAVCTSCAATPQWEEVSHRGTVYTFTIIRQYHAKPFGGELPYCVAMVDLDDAPVRMFGTLTGIAVDDVCVDLPVEAYAVEYTPGRAVPYWRPI
jgi:uncharacterized protein